MDDVSFGAMGHGERVGMELPSGTVTLVLADMEGSVRQWETAEESMSTAIGRIDVLVGETVARHGGVRPREQGEGDAFVAAFALASDALGFVVDFQRTIGYEAWPSGVSPAFRVAVHTGEVELTDDGLYAGPEINRCARVRDLGSGGQVLVTQATRDLTTERLPPETALRDLGTHRLRDMSRAERIYQLIHPELTEAPIVLSGTDQDRLPRPRTSFVGRETVLSELAVALRDAPVLTLTGAGGSGKTRLALELARIAAADFSDGARWVDLSAVHSEELVVSDVARALGVSPRSDIELLDAVAEELSTQQLLLVVDNCEHLMAACTVMVDQLSARCPDVTVLATSREALGVAGEIQWRVESMSVPPPDAAVEGVVASEAGELFVDRATKVRPNFRLTDHNASAIAAICRRLDGIPMAIELAAGRTRTMSPAQILASLDDRFRVLTGGPRTALPRQRALEASIEWSYDLLSAQERLLLDRLSVFAGSFDLDLAERVCGDEDLPAGEVLDALTGLVDRSMVSFDDSTGSGRYALLESVRVFARAKLSEVGDLECVRDRHLASYAASAEQVRAAQTDSIDAALRAFDAGLENLRSAMDWAVSSGQPLAVLDIIGPTFDMWMVRGLYAEATSRITEALASPDLADAERARGLTDASMMTLMAGDHFAAFDFARASVDLLSDDDPHELRARSWSYRGWSGFHCGQGDRVQVFDDFDLALRHATQSGDSQLLTRIRMEAGWVEACGRSAPRGQALLEEAVLDSVSAGRVDLEVPARAWLASTCMFQGDAEAALAHGVDALRVGRDLGYQAFVVVALIALGSIRGLAGDLEGGREDFAEAIELAADNGLDAFALGAHAQQAFSEALIGSVETAEDRLAEAQRLLRHVQYGPGGAHFALLAQGLVAIRKGDHTAATEFLTAARNDSTDPKVSFVYVLATIWLARLALADQRTDQAWQLAHEALDEANDTGLRVVIPVAIETVAEAAAGTGRLDLATRALGAAAGIRAERTTLDTPLDQQHRDQATLAARSRPDEDFDRLWAEGRDQTEEQIVAYLQRARGIRGRATVGWDSLTPTELNVVDLVVEGCTNKQISERMFISINTVRTHLSHIYTKLGVANRAELAASASRRRAP